MYVVYVVRNDRPAFHTYTQIRTPTLGFLLYSVIICRGVTIQDILWDSAQTGTIRLPGDESLDFFFLEAETGGTCLDVPV